MAFCKVEGGDIAIAGLSEDSGPALAKAYQARDLTLKHGLCTFEGECAEGPQFGWLFKDRCTVSVRCCLCPKPYSLIRGVNRDSWML